MELRDGGGRGTAVAGAQTIADAVAEEWGSTVWLRQVGDPTLLAEVGSAVAGALSDPDIVVASDGEEIRGEEIRSIDVGGLVRRRLADLDRVVCAAAGRLNTFLRTEQGPAVTRFFGDVLVYQRRRAEIRQRVREVIDTVDPALGRSPDRAVCVVGHSLGGVIAVDVATADDPLWVRSLVTFGSQSPFFHVIDPRGGQLLPFEEGHPVRLPTSVGHWTNLWEPMDCSRSSRRGCSGCTTIGLRSMCPSHICFPPGSGRTRLTGSSRSWCPPSRGRSGRLERRADSPGCCWTDS